ncbi:PD-(D/E)XK motif protein [Psychromonas sp. MB-3u-54]|uniref:PD-(D/E)XK motif protein n=1 Tax=Psychromonas sp. MB-3u-54 TaxID=2058319 RepID=UPI0012FF12EB|nr:PD-(D/E)XK motif protein [Psychromonas sp. MB-3u-54]
MNNPWENITTPKSDLSARRIDHKHPLNLYWAKDRLGRYLFVCELTNECKLPQNFPSLLGIDVTVIVDTQQLVLSLKSPSDWELFLALCSDVISATRPLKPSAVVPVVFRRIERWREFLKQDRDKILPERIIKGLIGELVYLQQHIAAKYGTAQAIDFWTGPEGSPQDFNIQNAAVEVKCQIGTSSPKVKISSAEQLCGQLEELYLFVVTLGKIEPEAKDALSLPSLIELIKSNLEMSGNTQQLEKFQDALLNIGYVYSERYLSYSYIVASKRFYEVAEQFPRLPLSNIPNGVGNVTYDLALINCEPFLIDEPWVSKL